MAESKELDVDALINKLLAGKNSARGTLINVAEADIRALCLEARRVLLKDDVLLELDPPLKVCGDIHGQFFDLLRIFEQGGCPSKTNYLFIGDYVDRGTQSIETMCLLLAFKIKYPDNFFLLRGNHESADVNVTYGFFDECQTRYSTKLWKTFTECFNCLPIAAIIDDKIFCSHGGLSPDLEDLKQIREIVRPTEVPQEGLLCDLLWSDPVKVQKGWHRNEARGCSYTFGADIVKDFLTKNGMELICRAHEVVPNGFQYFARSRLVTLFSAPNYCGTHKNNGAIMKVDEKLQISFEIITPEEKQRSRRKSIKAAENEAA